MTTFSTLAKSFNPGFRPDLQSNQISAAKTKKSCCCWNNKELEKELTASNNALSWIQANHGVGATDAEIKSIFQNVSGRKRHYQRITSGFWGWLRSLFRCRNTNRQLKNLAATLSSIQKVVVHSQSFQHSVFTQLQSSSAKQDLFKQFEKEFPQLIISKTPKASDFGLSKKQTAPNVPFLLHKTKNQIEVALAPPSPTAAPVIKKVANLKELPQVFSESIESRFTQLRDKKGCYESELNYNSATNPPPANKIHLNLEKDPVEGKCTLMAQIEHVLHGRQTHRYDLNLESTPAKAEEWIDGLVNENKAELNRIEQLRFDNPDFKVNWQIRRFTAEVTVGGHQESFISDDLSTEAFQRVKASKKLLEQKNEAPIKNEKYFAALPKNIGQPNVAIIDLLAPSNDMFIQVTASEKGFEIELVELFTGNGYSYSVGTFAPSENIQEIIELVKQKPNHIFQNLKQIKECTATPRRSGDYVLVYSLTPQKDSLPLFTIALHHLSNLVGVLVNDRIDQDPFTFEDAVKKNIGTYLPNDYTHCKCLCTEAEMDQMESNSTHFSADEVFEKVALNVKRVGDEWHYEARIYDLNSRTVKYYAICLPVSSSSANPADTIQYWINEWQKDNKAYLASVRSSEKYLDVYTGKSNALHDCVFLNTNWEDYKNVIVEGHDAASLQKLRQDVLRCKENYRYYLKNQSCTFGPIQYVIQFVKETKELEAHYSVQRYDNGSLGKKMLILDSSSHTLQEFIEADKEC